MPDLAGSGGLVLWLVVAGLAVVQSWFGVGLLLLGTPVLLLLGTPFRAALWILLPASLTVSLLQLLTDGRFDRGAAARFGCWAVPALIVGMTVVNVWRPAGLQIDLIVAAILAGSALLRLVSRPAQALRDFAQRHERIMLAGIGLLHGLTNMGGSLLSAYASARHVEKYAVRQHIALGYAIFASVQLTLLAIADGNQTSLSTVWTVVVAGLAFLTVGRVTFRRLSQPVYHAALSAFMLATAGFLVVRGMALP